MSVNYLPGFSITFCHDDSIDNPDDIPFYSEVNNIYHAYRRCYSKDPFADVKVDETTKSNLKTKFIKYFEDSVSDDNYCNSFSITFNDKTFAKGQGEEYFNELINFYGDKYYDFLYKCNFIKSHLNHESPFEHASLTVSIDGVSRSFTHQWVRSRIASHSQASQRYISEKSGDIDLVLPEKITDNISAMEVVDAYLSQLPDVIAKLADIGIKNEDIRSIFPNAMSTGIVTTMNFREWKHVFELRISSHAQKEFREVAYSVWEYLNARIPFVWLEVWDRKIVD